MKILKIACVGDSITYGSTLKFRRRYSYPSQLNTFLKPNYIVKNFGVSGACALKDSEKPYTHQKSFKKSIKFHPNIVFIMLGTNDSKFHNWDVFRFKSDYIALINEYINIDSKPIVYLLTPIPAFSNLWDIQPNIIMNQIFSITYEISEELNIELIDIYKVFVGKPHLTTDNIHPNKAGALLISKIIMNYIVKGDNHERNSN